MVFEQFTISLFAWYVWTSMLLDYVDFIVNLLMIVASWFLLRDLIDGFSWMMYECLVIFAYLNFDTHFGFLLMPNGERNGIKSRTRMSNQFNFKKSINSKTNGENLWEWSTCKKCVCVSWFQKFSSSKRGRL